MQAGCLVPASVSHYQFLSLINALKCQDHDCTLCWYFVCSDQNKRVLFLHGLADSKCMLGNAAMLHHTIFSSHRVAPKDLAVHAEPCDKQTGE